MRTRLSEFAYGSVAHTLSRLAVTWRAPGTDQVRLIVPAGSTCPISPASHRVNADFSALIRVDLETHRVVTVRHMEVGPIAFTSNEAWVLDETPDGTLHGIVIVDPRTNRVVRTVHVPDPGYDPYIVYGYGAMWVKGSDEPLLIRVDARTYHVTGYWLPGYDGPTDLGSDPPVVGDGSVWMRLNADWIARVDPGTGKIVAKYPSDGMDTGANVQVAFGSLWVASCDGGFVLRDRI